MPVCYLSATVLLSQTDPLKQSLMLYVTCIEANELAYPLTGFWNVVSQLKAEVGSECSPQGKTGGGCPVSGISGHPAFQTVPEPWNDSSLHIPHRDALKLSNVERPVSLSVALGA